MTISRTSCRYESVLAAAVRHGGWPVRCRPSRVFGGVRRQRAGQADGRRSPRSSWSTRTRGFTSTVKKPDGTVETWMVEGGTPNTLQRRGITRDTIKVGTVIIVDGLPVQGRDAEGERPQHHVPRRTHAVHGIVRHRRAERRPRPDGTEEVAQGPRAFAADPPTDCTCRRALRLTCIGASWPACWRRRLRHNCRRRTLSCVIGCVSREPAQAAASSIILTDPRGDKPTVYRLNGDETTLDVSRRTLRWRSPGRSVPVPPKARATRAARV